MDDVLKKLRYNGQGAVLALGVPEELEPLVSALEAAGAAVDRAPAGTYPFVIAFAKTRGEAERLAPTIAASLEGDALAWFCYPRGTSKRYPKPDVNRDTTWPLFEPTGLRPVAQVAVDADWSAIRLRRTEFVKS